VVLCRAGHHRGACRVGPVGKVIANRIAFVTAEIVLLPHAATLVGEFGAYISKGSSHTRNAYPNTFDRSQVLTRVIDVEEQFVQGEGERACLAERQQGLRTKDSQADGENDLLVSYILFDERIFHLIQGEQQWLTRPNTQIRTEIVTVLDKIGAKRFQTYLQLI